MKRTALSTLAALALAAVSILPVSAKPTQHKTKSPGYHSFRDIVVDADGSMYVLDIGWDEVFKLDKDGKLVWRAGLTTKQGDPDCYRLVRAGRELHLLFVVGNEAKIRALSTDDGRFDATLPFVGDNISGVDNVGNIYHPIMSKNKVECYEGLFDASMPLCQDEIDAGLAMPRPEDIKPTVIIDGNVEGPAHLGQPHRVEVSPDGQRIWVLDQTYVFKVFDGTGKFLYEVKAPDEKNRSFTLVVGSEFDGDGNAYLACTETKCVLKYDKDGKLAKKIDVGYIPGGFGLDSSGNIYIGDCRKTWECKINVLDQDGKLVRTIPVPPRKGPAPSQN